VFCVGLYIDKNNLPNYWNSQGEKEVKSQADSTSTSCATILLYYYDVLDSLGCGNKCAWQMVTEYLAYN